MNKFVLLGLICLATAEVIIQGRIIQAEGQLFSLQTVNSEEGANIESSMGCSLKCADTCFQFSKGQAAVQCCQLCGCKDLLRPIQTTELASDLSIEVSLPKSNIDDWDVDIVVGDKAVNIEAGKNSFEGTEVEHFEVDVEGADPNSKELSYEKVKTIDPTGQYEVSESKWTTPTGEFDGYSQEVKINKETGGYEKYVKSEMPNQGVTIEQSENQDLVPIEGGVVVQDQSVTDIKKSDPYGYSNSTEEIIIGQNSGMGYQAQENSGTIQTGNEITWQIISTVTIPKIAVELSSCEKDCSSFCSELVDSKPNCLQTCSANFCADVPAKVNVTIPKEKSFGIVAWIISLSILGVAAYILIKKMSGTKTRKVKSEVYDSSFDYIKI